MTNRYKEAMEHVRLTDEARSRILRNIARTDLSAPKPEKKSSFSAERWLSAAACLAILLTGGTALFRMHTRSQTEPPALVTPAPDASVIELSSAQELSDSIGFPVEDLSDLPFEVKKAAYRAHRKNLAEITYEGEGETATFRMSAGVEDNSGDRGTYGKVKNLEWDAIDATLKGSADLYTLATWTDGKYVCSLRISEGLSEAQWKALISQYCD